MGIVIQYVANYAPWIYAICGLVALYQLYRIWLVRAERKQAVFSLEREKAAQDTYNIFAIALVTLLVMGFTYFVSNTLVQAVGPLVASAISPTPNLPLMFTPTNTPLPATPTPTWTPTPDPESVAAAATQAAENAANSEEAEGVGGAIGGERDPLSETTPADDLPPTPTPLPTDTPAPAVQAPNCPDQRALIFRPGQNEVVGGVIYVVGTATHDSFQYYKVEYAPGANAGEGFSYVGGGNNPVVSNLLANIDTTALANGNWTIRLIVVDQTGNFPPPCQVSITVQN